MNHSRQAIVAFAGIFAGSSVMNRLPLLAADSQTSRAAARLTASDWPWWRGPDRNGIADARQNLPLEWSETENVLWKAKVPGRGHASPTVVGNRIFLPTADERREVQSVLCY